MSLCNICPKPGQCCERIYLTSRSTGKSLGDFETATEANVNMAVKGYPFVAIPERHEYGYSFTCPMLVKGRCSIYEHRPQLCKDYETASDPLCVFHGTNIKNENTTFNGEGLA